MKYVTVKIGNIITQIAKPTNIEGYTIGVLEAFMPDAGDLQNWNDVRVNVFIEENNKRMNAICKFLNDNNL